MKPLAALLLLAAAASASLSPLLALALVWLGAIAFLLLAVNRYRDALEAAPPEPDVVVGRIGPKRFVRVNPKHKEIPS